MRQPQPTRPTPARPARQSRITPRGTPNQRIQRSRRKPCHTPPVATGRNPRNSDRIPQNPTDISQDRLKTTAQCSWPPNPPPSQTHVTPRPHSHRGDLEHRHGDPTASASQIRAFARTSPKRWPRKPKPTAGPRASEARKRPELNLTNPKDESGSHPELQTGPMPKPKRQSHHQPSKAPASEKQRARPTVHACTRSAALERHCCSLIEHRWRCVSNDLGWLREERNAFG